MCNIKKKKKELRGLDLCICSAPFLPRVTTACRLSCALFECPGLLYISKYFVRKLSIQKPIQFKNMAHSHIEMSLTHCWVSLFMCENTLMLHLFEEAGDVTEGQKHWCVKTVNYS